MPLGVLVMRIAQVMQREEERHVARAQLLRYSYSSAGCLEPKPK
jgi:hypothetical protein